MSAKDGNHSSKPTVLKETREAKGLTLEIVHEATKIPLDALRAIEEGYSSRILSPFYFRGFIKIYAEFLGLEVAEMYKQYGIDQPAKQPFTAAAVKTPAQPAGSNLVLEQLQEGVSFVFKPKTLNLIFKAAGFLLLLFVLFKVGGCVASHWQNKKPASVRKQPPVEHERKAVQASVPTPPVVRHEPVQVPSANNKVEVAVRAVKDTWLRVKTDDKVVFEMTLSKGSMENWSADKTIELSGKNIDQLDMEINGKHVGTLGERRVRKVLVTKEGLTVKK